MRKITALCVAALIIVGGTMHTLAAPKSKITSSYLQDAFEHLNDGYFDGNLPRDTKVVYGAPPDTLEVIGETYCTYVPQGGVRGCTIYIVPKYNLVAPIALETLNHEACHIATYGTEFDHGPDWQNCMLNLAKEGAFEGLW